MIRVAIPVVFVIAATFGLLAWTAPRSGARINALQVTPTVTALEACTDLTWWDVDTRPPHPGDSMVLPAPIATPGETPTPDDPKRELYMVVITLPPGGCVPYDAPANRKNGAVIWIVQQGKVLYAWQPVDGADPAATPAIQRGDSASAGTPTSLSNAAGIPQTLYPGDWVVQDRRVQVTYRNIGGDSAVILKAVFALPEPPGGGCGGDCR